MKTRASGHIPAPRRRRRCATWRERRFMMAPLQEAQDDALLAEQLQSMLKPARGPAPKLSHICAAILLARDETLSSRAACRGVTGVPQSARDRVAELAKRVRPLLSAAQSLALPVPPSAPVRTSPAGATAQQQQPFEWVMPPLEATRERPTPFVPQESPDLPQESPVVPDPVLPSPLSPPASAPSVSKPSRSVVGTSTSLSSIRLNTACINIRRLVSVAATTAARFRPLCRIWRV